MTFTELMSLLNGNYIEVAGTDAKNQCVDLANAYIKHVLGLPPIEWTNAVDFPSKAGDKYEWIPNTPTGVPQEGDLVIWGGTYGHIAIFIEGNATRFTSFDENYPTGSPCRVTEHTYLSPKVLGWLHPKVILSDLQTQLDTCRVERDRNWNWYTGLCDILGKGSNYEVAKAELQKLVGIEDKYIKTDSQLKEAMQQVEDYKLQLDSTTGELEEIAVANNALTSKVADLQKRIDTATQANTTLTEAFESLKKQLNIPTYTGWRKIVTDIYTYLMKGVWI